MSNQWYDKEIYENYPSYLMGKTKEENSITKEFDNCRIRSYNFSKSDIPQLKGVFVPDVGIGASIIVEGTSRIKNNNQLEVSMSAIIVKDIQISGSVIVKQQGSTIDSCPLKLYKGGYIYESGAMKPIGEAIVELPYDGRYEVQVLISALHSSAGNTVFNTTIDLPYSK